MRITELEIPGVFILRPDQHGDERGFFSETWNRQRLRDAGIDYDFVQDNYSLSRLRGTVRGLHFQAPPHAQVKLVQVLAGRILDVAVDIRRGSPTFGRYVSAELSAAEWNQILVPVGFAHGFCTLEPDTAVLYKVTGYYSGPHDGGVLWNDPEIGIDWPLHGTVPTLSAKDQLLPALKDLDSPFDYRKI